MTDKEPKPSDLSGDQEAMQSYLHKVRAVMGGLSAMRAAGPAFLPKFQDEKGPDGDYDYKDRLEYTKLTNVFGDIVETLSAKPFEQEVQVENAGPVEDYLENIDGLGNHVHVFAKNMFANAVPDAITWVLVEYTSGGRDGATIAEERAVGARPYWLNITSDRVIGAYSEIVAGEEVFTHFRYREDIRMREGWREVDKERIRVYDREVIRDDKGSALEVGPPVWLLLEKVESKDGKEQWIEIDQGALSIDIIPVYPMITGKRRGTSWNIKPALADALDLQIDLYQEESGLKYKNVLSNFAMLAGEGVTDKSKEAPVFAIGPKQVLISPMGVDGKFGTWKWLEPSVEGSEFSMDYINSTKSDLRELGRQPLTAQSGNITTITAAFAGDKAHTVIEAWALNLKDTLENAFMITAKWLKSEIEPVVSINTDFSLSLREDTGLDNIDAARERNDISHETWFEETKRRGVLGPNRTFEQENERLALELPGDALPEDERAL